MEACRLAGLSPELRSQVQARAVSGNSVTEVLQVMLLNNIKIKHQASQIVAMDWAGSVAVVEQPDGGMAVVHFDPTTLQIKQSQVMVATVLATNPVGERGMQR